MKYKIIAFSRFTPPTNGYIVIPVIVVHLKDGVPVAHSINNPKGRIISRVFLDSGVDEGTIQLTIFRPDYRSKARAFLDPKGNVRYTEPSNPQSGDWLAKSATTRELSDEELKSNAALLAEINQALGRGLNELDFTEQNVNVRKVHQMFNDSQEDSDASDDHGDRK